MRSETLAYEAMVALRFSVSVHLTQLGVTLPLYRMLASFSPPTHLAGRFIWVLHGMAIGEVFELRINDTLDLRFPFCTGDFCVGRMHWDIGPLAPKLVFVFGYSMLCVFITSGAPGWMILWRHRHEKISAGKFLKKQLVTITVL